MPPDVAGTGGAASGVPIPPSAVARPVVPSRAVVPVERPGPRLPPAGTPLARSGVALDALFAGGDAVEVRDEVAPVAMEMGLESARRQLLQRQPESALAVLDAIWARAADSEEGWYLRSGALAVLGHPREGERVAELGIEARPDSRALRLLQSVSRAMVGDLSGARAALHAALDRAPADPVLRAQQAVLMARQGHQDDAHALLAELAVEEPDHPALAWARSAVRTARRDQERSVAQVVGDVPESGPLTIAVDAVEGDMVSSAFTTLGARLRDADMPALQQQLRMLLRACSAGGALASACTPGEAHAARQLLLALSTAVDVPRYGTPSGMAAGDLTALASARGSAHMTPHGNASLDDGVAPLDALVRQLVPVLRHGAGSGSLPLPTSAWDAERLLRRHAGAVPPAVRALLTTLVHGATRIDGAPDADDDASEPWGPGASVDGQPLAEAEQGVLVPVRLGLALLEETAATRALERAVARSMSIEPQAMVAAGEAPGGHGAGASTTEGRDWGAARARAALHDATPVTARSASWPAILAVAGALGAAMNGAAVLAALLGAVAMWLLLRTPKARAPRD